MQANVNNKVGKTENRLDLQNIEVGKWGGSRLLYSDTDCWLLIAEDNEGQVWEAQVMDG